MSFVDYLRRRTRSVVAALASPRPNPALILTFSADAAQRVVTDILTSPAQSLGLWRMELPLITGRFVEPLHAMPEAPLACTVRLQRRASAKNAADHHAMLSLNEALVRRFVPEGAKVYPPFAPPLSRDAWRVHFGAAWSRFAAAKQRYDPHHTLTPGVGIFDRA